MKKLFKLIGTLFLMLLGILFIMIMYSMANYATAQSTKFVLNFKHIEEPVKAYEINDCLPLLFYGEDDFKAVTRLKHDEDPLHIYINICGKGYNLILVPTKGKRDKLVYTFKFEDDVVLNTEEYE